MKIIWILFVVLVCIFGILFRTLHSLNLLDNNYDRSNLDTPNVAPVAFTDEYTGEIPYLKEMKEENLPLSLRQQQKFYANKDLISQHYSKHLMYATAQWKWWNRWHALILNDDFAFRHIFKNGGTTLEIQTGSTHVERKAIGSRRMVATVRDPIDHFVSGWQECGERFPEYMEWNNSDDKAYDGRIQKWLERTKSMAFKEAPCLGRCACAMHSFPQGNFLVTKKGTVDPKVVLVGDLREMPGLLRLTGFDYNHSIGTGRNASATAFKAKHFPRKKHLISNETMRDICDFVSLDYFLFDFKLPEACRM
jgi:hypothetical protein